MIPSTLRKHIALSISIAYVGDIFYIINILKHDQQHVLHRSEKRHHQVSRYVVLWGP